MPELDAQGHVALHERKLDVSIPKGIRAGQHLRLAGQGEPGLGEGPAGDLYLEIGFNPDPQFRVDGRDVFLDLPLAPWEAALGCSLTAPTPEGPVQLTVPAGVGGGAPVAAEGQRHSRQSARRSLRRAGDCPATGGQRPGEGGLSRRWPRPSISTPAPI